MIVLLTNHQLADKMNEDEEEDWGVYRTREGDKKCIGDVGKETGRK